MVLEIIFLIIFIGSLSGLVLMIARKAPLLKAVPLQETVEPDFLSRLKRRLRQNGFIRSFSWQALLRKLLSGTERQASCWLKKLKERSASQRAVLSDNYWKELKRSTRQAGSIAIGEEDETSQPEEVKIKVRKRGTGVKSIKRSPLT